MTSAPLLLDTCAVIWLFNRSPLSAPAREAIAAAATDRQLFVSPFSGWEIGMLVRKGKIALTVPPLLWFDKVVDHPAIVLATLTHDVLIESSFLPGEPPAIRPTGSWLRRRGSWFVRSLRGTVRSWLMPGLDMSRPWHAEAAECGSRSKSLITRGRSGMMQEGE
jgi:PIN domain nuclease of toxin-antitoxin system